jgi:transcriptional regulator GlxA family with amidase domain
MRSTSRTTRTPRRQSDAHRVVVARAEQYVHANLHAPLPVSSLCRIVGLSERALRNAFYDVHGVAPKRWMLGIRLQDVRHALTSDHPRPTTVTGIATAHGFYELGRFAATYREVFGEPPSATLRRKPQRGDGQR